MFNYVGSDFLGDLFTANSCSYNAVARYVEKFRYEGTDGHTVYYSSYMFKKFLRDGNHKAAAAYYLGLSIKAEKMDWKDMWGEETIKSHLEDGQTISEMVDALTSENGQF